MSLIHKNIVVNLLGKYTTSFIYWIQQVLKTRQNSSIIALGLGAVTVLN